MLDRNITIPHRFVVFTDNINAPFDHEIEPYPLWKDFHLLKTHTVRWRREFPQCYVRLRAFSREKEMRAILGPRYVSIDLDCVVLGNLDAILSRNEDFLIYRKPILVSADRENPYNGSMWMMDTGARPEVWEDFKGESSLLEMPKDLRFHTTDQGWMLHKLGLDEKGWGMDDGVFSWKYLSEKAMRPPENAKIIFFHGKLKPEHYLFIAEAYR